MRSLHHGRRSMAAIIVAAVFAVVLALPAAALAANTATFSLPKPAKGSRSIVARPAISIGVYDGYGVRLAANYSMTIDGRTVKPRIAYTKSGDYRRFKLTYSVPASLTVAAHKVAVRVHDLKHKTSTYSWTFTVLALPAAEMPVAGNSCVACHTGFPVAHPMTNCSACHGPSSPPASDGQPMNQYLPAERSAHTLGCALQASCHRGGGPFPHSLDDDCMRCHEVSRPGIPVAHTIVLSGLHVSSSAFCTSAGCHLSSLTKEHYDGNYRRKVGGTRLNCATCHASTDQAVTAAIASGSSACEDCHRFKGSAHAGTTAAHATPASPCLVAGCHVGQATELHAGSAIGCAACHGAGRTASTVCTTAGCHGPDPDASHSSHPSTITAGTITIRGTGYGSHLCSECHATTELQTVHGGASSCSKCHPSPRSSFGVWNKGCVQGSCHASGTLAMHGAIDSAHTAASAPSCVATDCHVGGTDVAKIHASQGCATCHGAGKPKLTLVCSTAGCHGAADTHPSALPHPKMTPGHTTALPATCAKTGCHAADLVTLHAAALDCATCHGAGKTPAKNCSLTACHSLQVDSTRLHPTYLSGHVAAGGCVAVGCHVTNVITLHTAGTTPPGCAACHGASRPKLTLVCATAGCHAAGVSALHSSHPSTVTSSTLTILGASYGKHLCSECHATTELQTVHGGASSCSKCHPAPRSSLTTWNKGCVQGDCHKVGSAASMHGSVDGAHTTTAVRSCSVGACHPGGTDAAAIHSTVSGRSDSGCGICHGTGKTPSLTCANCHAGDLTSTHATHIGTSHDISAAACVGRCHVADVVEVHGAPGGPGCAACHAPNKAASLTCTGCHPGHGLTLHPDTTTMHDAPSGTCVRAGCHASNVMTLHNEGGGAGCNQCHSPHTGTPGCAACHGAGKPKLTLECATGGCHPTGASALHSSHRSTVTSSTLTILGAGYGTHLCSECHATTELQAVHGGTTSCSKCHPSPRGTFAQWTGGCVQGDCHAVTSGLAMHRDIDAAHTPPASVRTDCGGAPCHGAVTDAAAIHSTKGCATCHGGGKTPTLLCSSCHTPHDLPALHATSLTSAVITINTVNYGSKTCSTCHLSADVRTGHPTACSTCHPGVATKLGSTWNKSCVQGGCHTAGSAQPVHAAIDASHIATVPGCTPANCHNGGSDVAKIHNSTVSQCSACHGAGKTLTTGCTSKGCHDGVIDHAARIGVKHTSGVWRCTTSTCHFAGDVGKIHVGRCERCHGPSMTPSVVCSDCHDGATTYDGRVLPAPTHATAETSHTAPVSLCTNTYCHGPDAAAVHPASGPRCVECHSAVKQASCAVCHSPYHTPSTDCTTCHGRDAFTATPHNGAHDPKAHLAAAGTCVAAGCHLANVSTVHSALGGGGCLRCHNNSAAPTLLCATEGCHETYVDGPSHLRYTAAHTTPTTPSCIAADCHAGATDVVRIHLSQGCAACHGVGKPKLTIACGTAGCHGAADLHPASDPHPKMTQGHTTGLSTTCVKSGCHVAELATLHAPALGCATCHGTGTTPSKDCSLGACHPHAVESTLLHPTYVSGHALAQSSSCVDTDCHADAGDVIGLHTLGTTPPGCEACHAADKPALTTDCATAGCHDANLADLHPADAHYPNTHPCVGSCHGTNAAAIHSVAGCTVCHKHGVSATTATCTTCHPLGASAPHTGYSVVGDFHGSRAGTGDYYGYPSTGWILAPYTRGASIPCATCHTLPGTGNLYNFATVVNGQPVTVTNGYQYTNLCVACHGGAIDDWHAGCIDCHGADGMGGGPATLVGYDCSRCHGHDVSNWPHAYSTYPGPTL